MAFYDVIIDGKPHGEVFPCDGRWRWLRPNGKGVETYHRRARMLTVREHIARLNRVRPADVRLVKQCKPTDPDAD
jgi:hypothetical protein